MPFDSKAVDYAKLYFVLAPKLTPPARGLPRSVGELVVQYQRKMEIEELSSLLANFMTFLQALSPSGHISWYLSHEGYSALSSSKDAISAFLAMPMHEKWVCQSRTRDHYQSALRVLTSSWTGLVALGPFFVAIRRGYLDIAKGLHAQGANVDARGGDGDTCLHLAVWNRSVDKVAALIEMGANPEIANNKGRTPLTHAIIDWGDELLEIVKALTLNGKGINALDSNGNTPLNWAAERGRLETVKVLIEKGAYVDIPNKEGWTPLMTAARNGYLELVKVLLNGEASPNKFNCRGDTALALAERAGHEEIARFLKPLTQGQRPAFAPIEELAPPVEERRSASSNRCVIS